MYYGICFYPLCHLHILNLTQNLKLGLLIKQFEHLVKLWNEVDDQNFSIIISCNLYLATIISLLVQIINNLPLFGQQSVIQFRAPRQDILASFETDLFKKFNKIKNSKQLSFWKIKVIFLYRIAWQKLSDLWVLHKIWSFN